MAVSWNVGITVDRWTSIGAVPDSAKLTHIDAVPEPPAITPDVATTWEVVVSGDEKVTVPPLHVSVRGYSSSGEAVPSIRIVAVT